MRLKDISINNLKRRKGKVFFLILGLTIGMTTVISLISISRSLEEDISKKLDEFGANILILPRSDDLFISYGGMSIGGLTLDARTLNISDIPMIHQIEARDNIGVVSPKFVGVVEIDGKKIPLIGVQFEEEQRLKKWWRVHGAFPKRQDEILIGHEVAVRLFKSTQDQLLIGGKEMKISGILGETGSQDDFLIFADLSFVQETLNRPKSVSFIEVAAYCHTCPIDEIVEQISQKLPHAKVTAIKQTLQSKMETLAHFRKFSVAISVIVLLIGGLIVFTNMMASVNERKREIGIFRAIGFRKTHIMRIIFLEAMIVGLIAGVLGYFLGLGISNIIGPMVLGLESVYWTLDLTLAIGAIFLSTLLGVLSSLYPAIHASKMDPTEALRAL